MARMIKRLSARQVAHAKPKRGRRALILADGGNLFLQVTKGADNHFRRSWVFRYERDGTRREMGLGATHTISLAKARDTAKALREQLVDGIDPFTAKREQAARRRLEVARAMSFGECVAAYLQAHDVAWKNAKHRAQWMMTLTKYCSAISNLPVRDVDTHLVLKVLEPIWTTKTETAKRLRGRIERVLSWAKGRGLRSGENPARWGGHLDEMLAAPARIKPVQHHAALPYADIPAFMASLRNRESLSARALEFTVLTGARTGEIIGASWDEIDFDVKVWTVPPERMKAGKQHRVPLSDRAIEILRSLTGHGKRVFPLSSMGMLQMLRGLRPGLTVHGFRSTFRDWAAERTNFANHIVEAALAHVIGDKVEAAYRRGDLFEKRRKLMAAWADYCARPPAEKSATVTPIRRKAEAGASA